MEYVKEKDFEVGNRQHTTDSTGRLESLRHFDSRTDLDLETNDPFFEYTFKIQQNLSLTYRFLTLDLLPSENL